jgi:hypothetical protein
MELLCNEGGIVDGCIDGAILREVATSGIGHDAGGCSGDIVVARFRGRQAELRCDKCGLVAGLVNPGIWADLVAVAPSRPTFDGRTGSRRPQPRSKHTIGIGRPSQFEESHSGVLVRKGQAAPEPKAGPTFLPPRRLCPELKCDRRVQRDLSGAVPIENHNAIVNPAAAGLPGSCRRARTE